MKLFKLFIQINKIFISFNINDILEILSAKKDKLLLFKLQKYLISQ